MKKYSLSEVFGVSAGAVQSYLPRSSVDERFSEALASEKQIVVYGASKQGKTALVSRYLPYGENVVINLGPRTELVDIYHAILRNCGIRIEVEYSESKDTKSSISAGARVKAMIPIFGGGEAEASGSTEAGSGSVTNYEEIPINLSLPQDVSELLKRVKGNLPFVILENFHYLDEERQKQLAFDFRSYQELGLKFVILGVWKEKNRLAQFNGDLLDRVIEIPVEPWTKVEFKEVARIGAVALNIEFSVDLVERAIDASFASIGVFQELLKHICQEASITETQGEKAFIDNVDLLQRACDIKAEDYSSRHQRALESIAAGNVSSSTKRDVLPLLLPYYLVKVILEKGFDGIGNGMRRSEITHAIQGIHHRADDVRGSDMSNLLHNLAKTQATKSISPPIIDYDQSKRLLQIVDSTFYFFLRHADLKAISEELFNPLEEN